MGQYPLVSVILPIRNEAPCIEIGLLAIAAQDYPADCIEVIIVDGMSTDNSCTIIHEFSILHPEIMIEILDNPNKIVASGMNIAIRQAKGTIIIRIDGHTVIEPNYVRLCVETLQRTMADNVGGRMNAIGSSQFGKALALATSTPFGIGGGRFHYSKEEEWVDTVYMGAWPRMVFESIGMFDEEMVRNQDDEFNYRLRKHGGRILLSPSIHSTYTVRNRPGALWRQYYQYGFWKVRVLQKHPRQMNWRQFAPPVFILSLIISFLLAFSPTLQPLSLLIPLAYLFANLLASIWTAAFKGWQSLPYLPLIFSILHISYGLGFLVGLVKFANRWGDKIGKTPPFTSEDARTS